MTMQLHKLFENMDTELTELKDEILLESDFWAKWLEGQLIRIADPSELIWLLFYQERYFIEAQKRKKETQQ